MTTGEMVYANKKKIHKYSHSFRETFNLNLCNYLGGFWQLLFGFDIIKFDKDIKTPDGTSTKEFILDKYGEEAVNLISDLLK